jgi:hypothetical protein
MRPLARAETLPPQGRGSQPIRPTKMNNIDTTIAVATNCVAELLALASGLIDDLESFGSECGDDYRAELQNIVDRFNAA